MKKVLISVIGLLVMMGWGASALAQDAGDATRDTRKDVLKDARDMQARDMQKDLRDRFKKDVEAKRADVKAKIDGARDALKAKLDTIRDTRKKAVVERIAHNVNALNEKVTNHAVSVLVKMTEVLERIVSHTDKRGAEGADVGAVRAAIAAAETAIATARTAVTAQAAKIYSITDVKESDLRRDLGSVRKQLHEDLAAMRKVVSAAHAAVRDVARALAQQAPRDGAGTPPPAATTP